MKMADGYAYSDGSGGSVTTEESARTTQANARKNQKKLSGARLARKREIDRQAQRSARVKKKNLIAYLETRIEELTRVHDSGDVKGLIDQLEEQRKANEDLRNTLQTIGKLVGSKTGDYSKHAFLWMRYHMTDSSVDMRNSRDGETRKSTKSTANSDRA